MAMTYSFKLLWRTARQLGVVWYLVTVPETVFAQDLNAVMNKLERLERDIRTLNIQISRGRNEAGAKKPALVAGDKAIGGAGVVRITQRLDNLEQDIRSATGSMEQLSHQIFQLTERVEKLVGDVDFRLTALEKNMESGPLAALLQTKSPNATVPGVSKGVTGVSAITSSGTPASKMSVGAAVPPASTPTQGPQTLGTVSAAAVKTLKKQATQSATPVQQSASPVATQVATLKLLPAGTPKEQYNFALNLLRQTKYDQAENALTEFIVIQGDHPLTGNARYWLGETYYVRANYEQAAHTFFQGYQASSSNVKAPDMLLKLGMSLAQLKKKTEACATFNKLSKDFPQASTRINSAVARERKRAGC